MKKFITAFTAGIALLTLSACSTSTASAPKFAVTSGVRGKSVKLTSSNYMNIKGTTQTGAKYVLVGYDGSIIDVLKVKNGKFHYKNNGSGGPYKIVLISTKSKATIGDSTDSVNGKRITLKVPSDGTADTSADSDSSSESTTTYGLNEKAVLSDTDANSLYGITVTSATKTFNQHGLSLEDQDSKDMGIGVDSKKAVQFTINYENIGDSENFLPSIFDFAAYDANGSTGDIVNQQDGQTEVSEGHNGTTTFWVNFADDTNKGDKVELDYQPDGLDTPMVFDLTVN